ncbi:MAG TPA: regulatory protein RecX [Gemmatimonadaceae bacterium]|jgi:regulatory protein|nr:regulatory protein RecX [Gemmatimonadaceae bacterium]
MNTITKITEHPRKPGRYVIDVDGKQFAIVTADALAATKARIGVVVDNRIAAHLNEANELTTAYDRALNLLAFRARSARELQRRLVQKGVTAARADRVIAKLRDAGLIDDADFARQLTRSKMSAGASRRRVHQELFKRGVPREVADEAVEQVVEEEGISDAESIERIARKKWSTLHGLDDPTRRRRLFGFLARRGFDSDDVSRVVRQLAGEATNAEE